MGHEPKNDINTRHKVVRFGQRYETDIESEKPLYQYLHQRADLKISKGIIPIDFLSSLMVEGYAVYLETKIGDYGIGPMFQVTWRPEREVIAAGNTDGWNVNLDELWVQVLSFFDRKNLLGQDTLEYLDADPFVLFGIDDPVTQQALQKIEKFPCLLCESTTPNHEEWSQYLRVDLRDDKLRWLVTAFAETELPKPWTCYKGVGSIVCYIRADTGQVTWKHAFYDYFRQLRDFCEEASPEEVMQVRVNRLLWSYEATRVETEPDQDPLICPEYVERMADIFNFDVATQGYLVRNLKAQLKVFAREYRGKQDIDISYVENAATILQLDLEKYEEMRDEWTNKVKTDPDFELTTLANGGVKCVDCGTVALCFCLECKDYLCLDCYDALHQKGARLEHSPFRLVPCALCVTMPAKLHCTFKDKSLCHECYAMKHITGLPPNGKENHPRRIDYFQQYARYAKFALERQKKANPHLSLKDRPDDYESVLSSDWHPFYDTRGVKYYHNFLTGERMRQSPRREPNTADRGAEHMQPVANVEDQLTEDDKKKDPRIMWSDVMGIPQTQPGGRATLDAKGKALTGFDSMKTRPAVEDAGAQPELRNMRVPFRQHKPREISAA